MRDVFGLKKKKDAQTLVFFILAFGVILLLCGLAIDSGLLYLAKARMGRAVDGAALAAVGNFHRSNDALTNRDNVAIIMRNFAVANFTDLSSIDSSITTSGGTLAASTSSNKTWVYNFNDTSGSDNYGGAAKDANGQYKRFVQVTLTTGADGNGITAASCNARCPVHTYFIGLAGNFFRDLKVSSSAVATRNPRLIMVVIDRSASMLSAGGGYTTLPAAVVQFLDFFDTSSDNIGIVSFGSSARLEMPMTTNFIAAGTNNLINAYMTNGSSGIPGVDSEQSNNATTYANGGIRRLKFGGQTAADEGIRLGLETMLANSSFNNPDVLKYMVIFTDGAWNQTRTLFASPGYKNIVTGPPGSDATHVWVTNSAYILAPPTNGATGIWGNDMTANTAILPVPIMSPMPDVTNAIAQDNSAANFSTYAPNHLNDKWLSTDASSVEPLPGSSVAAVGSPSTTYLPTFTTNTMIASSGGTSYYTRNLDVWLQPGSVDYAFNTNSAHAWVQTTFVSDYTNPTQHINITLNPGDSNVLVVPGYIADGLAFDLIDLPYPDNASSTYPRYRADNYQQPYMWNDDTTDPSSWPYVATSMQRQLMFRNYANLLTGFYIFKPDEPIGTGHEPLITEQAATGGAPRALYGLGPYYPSSGFFWPFDLAGVEPGNTFGLRDPNSELDTYGNDRHIAYSMNMSSTAAAPEWYGELFYKSIAGGGTNSVSGTGNTSVSAPMTTADWKTGAPSFVTTAFDNNIVMTSDSIHDTNAITAPSTWRPASYNGSSGGSIGIGSVSPTDGGNYTGGYVSDGAGHIYRNAMAYSGRPTHYYDFSKGQWVAISNNHLASVQFLPLGYWKAEEYAWHARAAGITIYTVGYGSHVNDAQQLVLAQVANATNTTGYGGSNISYNPSQPIGIQFQATTADQITADFQTIGQAINASLTQ